MKIAIVIPAYNEAQRIGGVIDDLKSLTKTLPQDSFDVIVVDDGSRDETYKVARTHQVEGHTRFCVSVLRHRTNLGKGAATTTGCKAAKKYKTDITVLVDGDGQHRTADVANLIRILKKQDCDVLLIGARPRNGSMPIVMRMGNAFLSNLARYFFSIQVQDSQSGLRAFPTSLYPKIKWRASNYAMETEMLIMARTSGVPLLEVPIETIYHDNHKGTTPLDGLKIVRTLLVWKFIKSPTRYLGKLEVDERVRN